MIELNSLSSLLITIIIVLESWVNNILTWRYQLFEVQKNNSFWNSLWRYDIADIWHWIFFRTSLNIIDYYEVQASEIRFVTLFNELSNNRQLWLINWDVKYLHIIIEFSQLLHYYRNLFIQCCCTCESWFLIK